MQFASLLGHWLDDGHSDTFRGQFGSRVHMQARATMDSIARTDRTDRSIRRSERELHGDSSLLVIDSNLLRNLEGGFDVVVEALGFIPTIDHVEIDLARGSFSGADTRHLLEFVQSRKSSGKIEFGATSRKQPTSVGSLH